MQQPKKTTPPRPPIHGKEASVEIVDPGWLLKALGLSLFAAALCVYLVVFLLYYQGAWQLVLNPSRKVDRTPASEGLAFDPIRFGDFDTGMPHLTGWWIPAAPSLPVCTSAARDTRPTVLYLHGGSGSLSQTVPRIALLHRMGLNVFAIDYRGFGQSDASIHPDAGPMQQDASAAFSYLVDTRHIPAASIIPMGAGVAGSLAVQLAQSHPELPAVILDNPDPDPAATASAVHPSHLMPIHMLVGRRFAIAASLRSLHTPKLLIGHGASAAQPDLAQVQNLFQHASSPSYSVILSPASDGTEFEQALRRFLDQYVPCR